MPIKNKNLLFPIAIASAKAAADVVCGSQWRASAIECCLAGQRRLLELLLARGGDVAVQQIESLGPILTSSTDDGM